MQIFEFELIEPIVTAPQAVIAPVRASARREHLLEQERRDLAWQLNLAVPFHLFVSGSAEATSRQSWTM